jgi:hypothetical protein
MLPAARLPGPIAKIAPIGRAAMSFFVDADTSVSLPQAHLGEASNSVNGRSTGH